MTDTQIRAAFNRIRKQVQLEEKYGVRCVGRTDSFGMEHYHLIDKAGRTLTGECNSYKECWLSYLD